MCLHREEASIGPFCHKAIHTTPTDTDQCQQSPDYSMTLLRYSNTRQTQIQHVQSAKSSNDQQQKGNTLICQTPINMSVAVGCICHCSVPWPIYKVQIGGVFQWWLSFCMFLPSPHRSMELNHSDHQVLDQLSYQGLFQFGRVACSRKEFDYSKVPLILSFVTKIILALGCNMKNKGSEYFRNALYTFKSGHTCFSLSLF